MASRSRVKQDAHLIRPTSNLRWAYSRQITVVRDNICIALYPVIATHGTHPPVMSTSAQFANVHPILRVSPIHLHLSIWAPFHPGDLSPLVQNPGLTSLNLPTDQTCVLLGCYAASSGNFLPTFREDIALPFSLVKNPKEKNYWYHVQGSTIPWTWQIVLFRRGGVLDPWRWERQVVKKRL